MKSNNRFDLCFKFEVTRERRAFDPPPVTKTLRGLKDLRCLKRADQTQGMNLMLKAVRLCSHIIISYEKQAETDSYTSLFLWNEFNESRPVPGSG